MVWVVLKWFGHVKLVIGEQLSKKLYESELEIIGSHNFHFEQLMHRSTLFFNFDVSIRFTIPFLK